MKKILAIISNAVVFLTFFLVSLMSHAAYWDEKICGWSMSNTHVPPGTSVGTAASVSAQRDATSSIPIYYYLSQGSTVSSSSQYLGSSTATVLQPGSFCSALVSKTVTIPTAVFGGSCIASPRAYIVAKTGDNERPNAIRLNATGQLPEITSFSPSSAQPGAIITIVGLNLDEATAVYIDGIEAARQIVADVNGTNNLIAEVPHGATTGSIEVRSVGPGYKFCTPPSGFSSVDLIISDPYCLSEAFANNYARIDYVETSEFINDRQGVIDCPNYSEYTNLTATASLGGLKEILVQLDTCNNLDYSKLFKAYVDWNQDNDFDDPGEFIVDAPSVSSEILYSINTSVPASASIGTTRMRLITALYYTGYVDTSADVEACGTYPFGETQDYSIEVTSLGGVLQATVGSFKSAASKGALVPEGLVSQPLLANPKSSRKNVKNIIPSDKYFERLELDYAPR